MRIFAATTVFAALLAATTGAARSDTFDFAAEAHRGHFISIYYQTTGTRIAYSQDMEMRAQDDFVDYADIYIHVSPDNRHFLFFGGCVDTGFEAVVRDGHGVALGGEQRIFDIDCLPDAGEGDDTKWARGRVSFDADEEGLDLSLTWMRHEDVTDDTGQRRVRHTKSDLSLSVEFEQGRIGERDCRIADLTSAQADETQAGAADELTLHDHSFTVAYLSRQMECEERPTRFPPPPGTGKPIPPTPHATP
ncbi:MAG: hypothetical protein KF849_11260 [Rhizobiaceae bacterium]|nr:hypothetical protein [Rhizobiaceae bacterium]